MLSLEQVAYHTVVKVIPIHEETAINNHHQGLVGIRLTCTYKDHRGHGQ